MPLALGEQLPSMDGATAWFGSPISSDDLRGRPVIVQVWAASCPMCKTNMPRLLDIVRQFQEIGIRLVSIHMPRMEEDLPTEIVIETMTDLSVPEPCALDNEHIIGERFDTEGRWPSYYLFDHDGRLLRQANGEMGLRLIRISLERLARAPLISASTT